MYVLVEVNSYTDLLDFIMIHYLEQEGRFSVPGSEKVLRLPGGQDGPSLSIITGSVYYTVV